MYTNTELGRFCRRYRVIFIIKKTQIASERKYFSSQSLAVLFRLKQTLEFLGITTIFFYFFF